MVDSRHASAAAHAGGACAGSAQYVVTILGIASQAVNEARYNEGDSRPNPSSAERSPRMRASEPSASRKERERQGSQEDDFQVYFGDLPSPRMIEVVKPKEVQLPSWRVTSAAKSAAAETRRGAAGDSDSSDEDTNDAVFQSRHNRALERAVAAAKVTLTLTLTLTLTRSLSLSLSLSLTLARTLTRLRLLAAARSLVGSLLSAGLGGALLRRDRVRVRVRVRVGIGLGLGLG